MWDSCIITIGTVAVLTRAANMLRVQPTCESRPERKDPTQIEASAAQRVGILSPPAATPGSSKLDPVAALVPPCPNPESTPRQPLLLPQTRASCSRNSPVERLRSKLRVGVQP